MAEQNPNVNPKPSKKRGWLIGGGILALIAVVVVIGVFAQRGEWFRGFTELELAQMFEVVYVDGSLQWQEGTYTNLKDNSELLGTKKYPFKTIKEAITELVNSSEKDTIRVAGGDYVESLNLSGWEVYLIGGYNSEFTAQNEESVIKGGINFHNVKGKISGFTFDLPDGKNYALDLYNGAGNDVLVVENNKFKNGFANENFVIANNFIEVRNNTFDLAKSRGSVLLAQGASVVEKNVFYRSLSGIAADGIIRAENNSIVRNNLIVKSLSENTHAIRTNSMGGLPRILNNTIADNNISGAALSINGNANVTNNLIVNNQPGEATKITGTPNVKNNGFYATTFQSELLQNENYLCNPKFKSSRGQNPNDYKLGDDSTCINSGRTDSYVTDDYFGTSRPQGDGYDIGFHEVPIGPICGNGTVEEGEQCDDGNTNSGDGCSSTCNFEVVGDPLQIICGNSILEQGEECDDGNTDDGDGCDSSCQLEAVPADDDDDDVVIPPPEETVCGQWSDVSSSDPEYDIWMFLCEEDIFRGYPDGTLRPGDELKRSELLALAFRASDEFTVDEQGSNCFNDVKSTDWFSPYACEAKNLGFVQGYSGNLFKPSNNVILAEGLKMFLGAQDIPYQINSDPNKWYYDMLKEAADNNWLPYTLTDEALVGPIELTRRKAANMIYRIMIYP